MVLQIRFAIWLTLQIEVEALYICKPSHHFASTISAFYVGLRPPGSPPRAISLRPSALPAARAHPPYRARPRRLARVHERRRTRPRLEDIRGHGVGTEVDLPSKEDGGGRSRTDANDDGDKRRTRPGLGGD